MNIEDGIKTISKTVKEIYQWLGDKESKEIFLNLLTYQLTDDNNLIKKNSLTFARRCPLEHLGGGFGRIYYLLQRLPTGRNFVLFGAGRDGASLLPHVMQDKRFVGFCSSTKAKQKNGYLGFPVMSPQELLACKDLSVIIATSNDKEEITQILRNGGYPQELIFDGPAAYKPDLGTAEQYFGPEFLKFEDREVFVDVGCFDFGSSLALAEHCKCVKSYAFEPDPQNYLKCKKRIEKRNIKRLPEVKLFSCGAWSEKTTLRFNASADMNSRQAKDDDTDIVLIPTITIDEVIDPGDRITMIKMDIEGAELEALKGAKETIQRDRPKLAICIYHKPEDLWEIPLYIKELVPEYRFYIRHHGFGKSETVLYAIMP